jgi:hypothetical protein
MSVLVNEFLLGCRRSLAAQAIAIFIVVPLTCALICLPLWLVMQQNASIWLLIVLAALFLLILIGGGVGAVAWTFRRRAQKLDDIFGRLGLSGSLYQLYYRKYHGRMADRSVAVYFYRGPTLEIEVETALQTRMAVTRSDGDATFFSRLLGREPMQIADERTQGLLAFAIDEEWARGAITDPDVSDCLHRLLKDSDAFIRRHVVVQPGRLRLTLFGSRSLFSFELDPVQAEGWVNDMLALARALDLVPDPKITDTVTSAEEIAQSVKQSSPTTLWKITLLVVLGTVGCACGAGLLGFLWALSQ